MAAPSRAGRQCRAMPIDPPTLQIRGARLAPGQRAAVVGGGAVGLCCVLAAKRLGAERIILLDRHPDRIALGLAFGATDIVTSRGEQAKEDSSHASSCADVILACRANRARSPGTRHPVQALALPHLHQMPKLNALFIGFVGFSLIADGLRLCWQALIGGR